jgi:hypothetical protein
MAASQVSTSVLQSVRPSVTPIAVHPVEQITQLELAGLLSLRNRARQIAEQVEAADSLAIL